MSTVHNFKLSEQFLDKFKGKQPKWGPLGPVVYYRTYSRVKEDGTNEEFWETLRRVVEGCFDIQKKHCAQMRLDWSNARAQKTAQEMFQRMWDFKFLPPGRGLWMMGTRHVENTGASLSNCGFVSTQKLALDIAEPFCWAMEMLMLGVGVGYDSLGAGTVTIKQPKISGVFVVPDTREGWVDALRTAMTAFTGVGTLPSKFDYSLVREKGAPIKGFGGTASGPEPLIELVERVISILTARVGETITLTDINDIFNLIGRCVVAGNVRRSSLLSMGSASDKEFMLLKDPELNGERLASHGWASNNSISATVGMDYTVTAEQTAKNGEPGYIWLENCRTRRRFIDPPDNSDAKVMGLNPCVEQQLEDRELCCLVETFPSNHDNLEDYKLTLKYAYLYGKTVTLVPTHSLATNAIIMRNRRIGCSMSGIVQAINKFGTRNFFSMCDQAYKHLRDLDHKYSDWLGVPLSKRITTVKPSGSISCLPGVTPGVHFPHSEYYIRRVRMQEGSELGKIYKNHGYKVEKDVYAPNTEVVEFPIKEENFGRSKNQVTMWEQLELAANMQYYWSDNSVSVTVTVNDEEKKDIKTALELYETRLKAVSFLPLTDHKYAQAPYEEVTKEQYEEMMSRITPITSYNISNSHETTEVFCTNDVCEIRPVKKE